jgi:chromosome segregation ATPase
LRRAEGALSQYPEPAGEIGTEEVSVALLANELDEVRRAATAYDLAQRTLGECLIRSREAAEALDKANEAVEHAKSALGELQPVSDGTVERVTHAIASAQATNAAVSRERERREHMATVEKLRTGVANRTKQIESLDAMKAEGLAAAKMPTEGLSFDEDGVTYNGLAFSQASSAEQLRVSCAIGMAAKPEIRIMRITDGSLLDSTNLAVIEEMAREHEYQVWIERVDESGTIGVVIEDGEVAGEEYTPEPARETTPNMTDLPVCQVERLADDGTEYRCARMPHNASEPHDWVVKVKGEFDA